MEAGWIQVFVLILSECVAPAGKQVCQEQEVRYEFFSSNDCEVVLEQLIAYEDSKENVIVNKADSSCLSTAKNTQVYATSADINEAFAGTNGWGQLPVSDSTLDFTQKAHLRRLGDLNECADVDGVAPCKIGDIIVEGASEGSTDVWRQSN